MNHGRCDKSGKNVIFESKKLHENSFSVGKGCFLCKSMILHKFESDSDHDPMVLTIQPLFKMGYANGKWGKRKNEKELRKIGGIELR